MDATLMAELIARWVAEADAIKAQYDADKAEQA